MSVGANSRFPWERPRPPAEWLRTPAEHLRLIEEPLWRRSAARRAETQGRAVRFASGRLSGRPPKHATKNLLAGLATCALCGGGLVVATSPRTRGRVPEYVCHRHRANGTCTNALHLSVEEMNEAVLNAIEAHALTPDAIEQVIRLSERDDLRERQVQLEREQQDIEKRMARLVAAIETGGEVPSIIAKLRDLEAQQQALRVEAARLRPVPRLAPVVTENRLAEWRRLLRSSTTQGRTVLQRILRGRLTFTPRVNPVSGEVDGYDFEAPTRFDKLFTGVAVERPGMQRINAQASPYLASHFSSGPQELTITTRTAQLLSVIAIPAGIELSVHLVKGEFQLPDGKTGPTTFSGDVSIRTRPRSELVDGPMLNQMMSAAFRLDVQDAVVVVTRKQ